MEGAFNKAKSLLAHCRNRNHTGPGFAFQDSAQAAEDLCGILDVLESLQPFIADNTVSWEPSSPEWKVFKTLLELLIRLGISPYLSPGVGILRERHLEVSCRAFPHASSLDTHMSRLSLSNPSVQSSALAPESGLPVLFVCTEALASFTWNTGSPDETAASLPSAHSSVHFEEVTQSGDEYKRDKGRRSTYVTSPDTSIMPFSSKARLVMKFFLWDVIAAYLQLGFGPKGNGEDVAVCSQTARVRLKHMVDSFPVEQMIVASFVLLNREFPAPPPWVKAVLGKQLSNLVMRTGGLVTTIKELVGRVTKGNVESYDRVAGHLAKIPKSVATADQYFKAVCPQLLPLLLFKYRPQDLVLGETSLTALNNIYHTAVSLACKLFLTEPVCARKYLMQPLIRPLLALEATEEERSVGKGVLYLKHTKEHHVGSLLTTENEVVNSLVQLGVLLTAGSQGSSAAREVILYEARCMTPLLLELHFQIVNDKDPNGIRRIEKSAKSELKAPNMSASESKGISRGLLEMGSGYGEIDEQAYEHQSALSMLRSSLTDVVMAGMNQSVELALPSLLSFLWEDGMNVVRWPEEEGEIWKALQSKTYHSGSKAMYLSRLLLMVENWALVLSLMGELLRKILNLRQTLIKSDMFAIPTATDIFRYINDFEELNSEAGTKALENDTAGASVLVQALLDDELVLSDEDMLELVLHMVNSLLKGIRSSGGSENATMIGAASLADGSVLTSLLSSLEKVNNNESVNKRLRQMSFTLFEVLTLCKAL